MKTISQVTVFIASPGDVLEERDVVESAISRLNISWAPQLNVQIRTLRWESHTHPSAGSDLQTIINEQIGSDYDLLLGIFWSRLGTPTPRASSGAVEEFERAYHRYLQDPKNVKIMLYFKTADIPMEKIDSEQIYNLKNFKQEIGKRGILYQDFKDTREFENFINIQLIPCVSQIVLESRKTEDNIISDEKIKTISDYVVDQKNILNDPDVGYLDCEYLLNMSIKALVKNQNDISISVASMTAIVESKSTEFQRNTDPSLRRNIVKQVADSMAVLSRDINQAIPVLNFEQKQMYLASAKILEINNAEINHNSQSFQDFKNKIILLASTYKEIQINVMNMRNSIEGTPGVTADLNKAKRNVVKSLDSLLAEYASGERFLRALGETEFPPR